MELRFSVLARDRRFSKAMQRIRPRFAPLLETFQKTEVKTVSYDAILVGITDDKGPEFFKEIPNNDDFFQVLAGCTKFDSDSDLVQGVFEILHRATMACPFGNEDFERLRQVFEENKPEH